MMDMSANGVIANDDAFKPDFDEIYISEDEMNSSHYEPSPILPKKPSFVNEKVKRKAKRIYKTATTGGEDGAKDGSIATNSSPRDAKNSRRPRTRCGRGLPKKGGAGGKGTWGKPGCELGFIGAYMNKDIHDPNYDSDSEESIEFESIIPEMSDEDLEKDLSPIFMEYFEHGDSEDVIASIEELNIGKNKPLIVVYAIIVAMERKPSYREMTSVMLSDIFGKVLTEKDIEHGFDLLLEKLPDLVLDSPDAAMALGNFIARAIADDCLPPKYVQVYKGKLECIHARSCLEHANTLLNMKHGLVRLDNVWGVGGGMRPVKYLVKQIKLLLKEYLCSADISEATRCLQELEVPHFHHELVYQAVVIVIEDMGEDAMEVMCKLLKSLSDAVIISLSQLNNGFERVYVDMPDICIDVPPAYTLLKQFVTKCDSYGFLSPELIKNIPTSQTYFGTSRPLCALPLLGKASSPWCSSRGRKRFVSEGDGGLFKDSV